MKTSMALLSLLILLVSLQSTTSSSSSTLEDLCSMLGESYIVAGDCIKTLGAVPGSHDTDAKGLGVIALNLTISKLTAVKTQIEDLLAKAPAAKAKRRAAACLLLYSNIIPSLRWSAESIASEFYDGAGAVTSVALSVPSACSEMMDIPSKDDEEASNLIMLANAIATHLKQAELVF